MVLCATGENMRKVAIILLVAALTGAGLLFYLIETRGLTKTYGALCAERYSTC